MYNIDTFANFYLNQKRDWVCYKVNAKFNMLNYRFALLQRF